MAQFARPNADITVGLWYRSDDDTQTNIYQMIDEATRSDADYIYSGANQTTLGEIGLSAVTDPESSSGHILRYTYSRNKTNKAMTLVVRLVDPTNGVIASWTHVDPTATFTLAEQTLTTTQADNITDYSNISVQYEVTVNGGGGQTCWISWTELEVPDAGLLISATTTDGINSGDSSLKTATLRAVSLDGIDGGDGSLKLASFISQILDGVEAGDFSFSYATLRTLSTDGTQFSDSVLSTVSTFVSALVSDGILVGDSILTTLIARAISSEQIDLSDEQLDKLIARATSIDGVNLSETELASVIVSALISDGVNLSESGLSTLIARALALDSIELGDTGSSILSGVLSSIVSDGITFSEEDLSRLQAVAQSQDTVSFGETVLRTFITRVTAVDGAVFSEDAFGSLGAQIISALVSESLELGETSDNIARFVSNVSDGTEYIDTPTPTATFSVLSKEGVSLQGVTLRIIERVASVIDGIDFSDSSSPRAVLRITVEDSVQLEDISSVVAILSTIIEEGIDVGDLSKESSTLPVGIAKIYFEPKVIIIEFEGD